MDDIKVIDVKVVNKEAIKARIGVGPFEIDFLKTGENKIMKTSVVRYDKQIANFSDLYVPSYFYEPAKRKAYGIFFQKIKGKSERV